MLNAFGYVIMLICWHNWSGPISTTVELCIIICFINSTVASFNISS